MSDISYLARPCTSSQVYEERCRAELDVTAAVRDVERRARLSTSSDDSIDIYSAGETGLVLRRASQDTVYSHASSFSDVTVAPELSPVTPIAIDAAGQRFLAADTTPRGLNSFTDRPGMPPARPPRAIRTPKITLVKEQTGPTGLDCHGTFSRFEPLPSPVESTHSCNRGDSIDLDPDFAEEAAKHMIEDDDIASQFPEPPERTSSTPTTSLLFSTVDHLDKGRPWMDEGSRDGPSSSRAVGSLAHSASRTSLSSAFSTSSGESSKSQKDDKIEGPAKLFRAVRVSNPQKNKALFRKAFKKLGPNKAAFRTSETAPKGELYSLSPKSACSSCSLSTLSGGRSPSNAPRRLSSESELSSVGPPTRSPTPTLAYSPILGKELMPRVERKEELMDVAVVVSPRPAHDSSFDAMVESHVHLPSYHRALRKQIYPPRVRYGLRDNLSPARSPQQQQPSLPPPLATSAQRRTRFAGSETQAVETARAGSPRLEFGGLRRSAK